MTHDETTDMATTAVYTVDQVAELLHVAPRTVRRWIESGTLKAHRIGRLVRIREEDLQELIDNMPEVKPGESIEAKDEDA